ncbi:MAG: TIGR00282 family metallophosphoesterase [Bacilli bacterium]
MKILFIGDVTGRQGLMYVRELLPNLRRLYAPDLVIANGENSAANGRGITENAAEHLYDSGVDAITLGNHAWDQKEVVSLLARDRRICRPANLHPEVPGQGYTVVQVGVQSVAVINLVGRTFMSLADCPFRILDHIIDQLSSVTDHIFVDFHAEATSEKLAMGWYAAGRVSAVIGTHTHVQTADERILPNGTAFLTDVGMTGPRDGILGVERATVIKRFMDQMPARFAVADGPRQLSAVILTVGAGGRASQIERIAIAE